MSGVCVLQSSISRQGHLVGAWAHGHSLMMRWIRAPFASFLCDVSILDQGRVSAAVWPLPSTMMMTLLLFGVSFK